MKSKDNSSLRSVNLRLEHVTDFQNDLHLSFIDDPKRVDKVQQEDVLEILGKLYLHGKNELNAHKIL